jgi:hypothetical protein
VHIGYRALRVPTAIAVSRPRPPRSDANAACSATPSATRSSCGCWNPTRSTGSSGKPRLATQTVNRRVVTSPAQISGLLTAVRGLSGRGEHLEAFYACLYYAYLRPSEAVMLKETDCRLPSRSWGRLDLAASAARAGKDWTDDGTGR